MAGQGWRDTASGDQETLPGLGVGGHCQAGGHCQTGGWGDISRLGYTAGGGSGLGDTARVGGTLSDCGMMPGAWGGCATARQGDTAVALGRGPGMGDTA